MPLFWIKWLDDIADAQGERGEVPDIAPNYVRREDPDPAWGGNYPILVWYLYQYYGDRRLLEEHYAGIKRWVDYLASVAEGHLVTEGHYGDHMLPGAAPGQETFISQETPPPLVWTGYHYRGASIVSQAAETLGLAEDAARYARLADQIADALNAEWFDRNTSQYATGSQTANLFPLVLGIVPAAHREDLVKHIAADILKHDRHHHTGNTGTMCLIEALAEHGEGELLYQVVSQKSYPGWGYMVERGATTIWESWSLASRVGDSESMIMWATVEEFFYGVLAGIKGPDYHGPGVMAPGFCEIQIAPQVLGDLARARASIQTVRGVVSSSWVRDGQSIALAFTIPANSRARVSVPTMGLDDVTISEGGQIVWEDGAFVSGVPGVSGGSEGSGCVTFDVGSGAYRFVSMEAPGHAEL
jgi:alpha-L-rhamnosidase